jgi:anti-anti-sigma regulatory factor
MNAPSARMSVLAGKQFACIKISGRANLNSSVDFRTVINELLERGYTFFVLELSECMLMDSTFLGVLAGFGLKLGHGRGDGESSAIELLNPNTRIVELLESLGVLHLFRLANGPLTPPEGAKTQEHEPLNPSKEEKRLACLEAHRTLMEINPENIAKFKDITQFLAEDLKRDKDGGP